MRMQYWKMENTEQFVPLEQVTIEPGQIQVGQGIHFRDWKSLAEDN